MCITVIKTGSAGLIAYRLMSRDAEWVWLQTSARVVYKNSKPEFIIAVHRHLTYVLHRHHTEHVYLSLYDKRPLAAKCCLVANDLTNFTGD